MNIRRLVLVGAAGLACAVTLVGCSSGSTPTTPSSTAPAPSASDTSSVLPPVMVEEGTTSAKAKVGDTIVFNTKDPAAWTITSGEGTVVAVTPGGNQGTYTTNPSGKALAAGNSRVTLTPTGGGKAWVVDVTVTD